VRLAASGRAALELSDWRQHDSWRAFADGPFWVKRRPSGAVGLGLFNPQQRTSEDCRSTSENGMDRPCSRLEPFRE
jgi:hypothetical protein